MRKRQGAYNPSSGDHVDNATASLLNAGQDPAREWLAEQTIAEASRRRGVEHSLLRQIRETATLAGSLAELAERGRPISLSTTWGRTINGVIAGLGDDFVELRGDSGTSVLRLESMAYLRVSTIQVLSDRDTTPRSVNTFAERVRTLAIERPHVQITCQLGTVQVSGVLEHVGADVITVAIDGPRRSSALVPIARVAQVQLV